MKTRVYVALDVEGIDVADAVQRVKNGTFTLGYGMSGGYGYGGTSILPRIVSVHALPEPVTVAPVPDQQFTGVE